MKTAELKQLTSDKLKTELEAAYREMFNLRMQRAGGQMTKNHSFKKTRRHIARIRTILNEKAKS
ncbi:MAG: 50S ribosomal protein L29 [Gammaproteobacteria bacterium]